MEYLETIVVPLASLQRFPGNARKHARKALLASVREGQYKSLLVRRLADGALVVVAGNGTADALVEAGATQARVEVWDYTDTEARRVNVKDNRLSDLATDDLDALAGLFAGMDGDTADLGWTDKQVAKILAGDFLPDPGDADTSGGGDSARWGLVIECGTEDQQVELLERFAAEGLNVRAIVS